MDAALRDDAAVYKIAPNRALVATVDFFTPIVDDPFDFGRIAAANALSDIYAMGARPLFALNLVSFPRSLLGQGLLREIIRGGAEKALEAGIGVLGGHSVDDAEPKYGMAVLGEADPARIFANDQAADGDDLILTKPLGTGIVATAVKKEACPPGVLKEATRWMARLNRGAAQAAAAVGIRAATDVTGYGLLGHLANLLEASGVSAVVDGRKVPVIEGASELARAGYVPGGTRRNELDAGARLSISGDVSKTTLTLLCDAQTSGGLILSCPPSKAERLARRLRESGEAFARIGRIRKGSPGRIELR